MPAIKGKPQERGKLRRQAITVAAFELMATRGFRGTTLAAIAERVGLTEAGVLHHFDSKEDLLTAVLTYWERAQDPELVGRFAAGGIESLELLPEFATEIKADPSWARLINVLQAEHLDDDTQIHGWFAARAVRIRRLIAGALERGIEAGDIRDDLDVQLKAAEIMAFMDGIQGQWLLDPSEFDIVLAYETYTRDLVASVRCRPPGRRR